MILDLLAKKYGENHRTAITADMGIVLSTFLSLKLIIFKKRRISNYGWDNNASQ